MTHRFDKGLTIPQARTRGTEDCKKFMLEFVQYNVIMYLKLFS